MSPQPGRLALSGDSRVAGTPAIAAPVPACAVDFSASAPQTDVLDQIAELERQSLRAIRELLCGDPRAMNVLQNIEDEIVALRDQLP